MGQPEPLEGIELQRQTLRLYGEILCRLAEPGGALVFACGARASGTGLPAAASLAGATSMVVDADAAAVKAVLRQGGVDFVVNTLDEALRILKNEIRKRRPVSVALVGDPETVVQEMLERGVLPDLWVEIGEGLPGVGRLRLECGDVGVVESSERSKDWLRERGWVEQEFVAGSAAEMRVVDAGLMEALPVEDTVRRVWVQRISQYQRGSERVVWVLEGA